MVKTLTFNQIDPRIWITHIVTPPASFEPIYFRSYTQRIYFIKSGSCTFTVNDVRYPMKKNSLILIRCGDSFSLTPNKEEIHILSAAFSYTSDHPEWNYIPNSSRAEYFDWTCSREEVHFTDYPFFNQTIHLHNMYAFKDYLTECLKEYRLQKRYHQEICSNLMRLMLNLIRRNYELYGSTLTYDKKEDYVDAIIEYIQENYHQDISNNFIGKAFNLHPNYINKLMLRRTGSSLHQYLISIRIENAIKLFNTTKMTVSEVANAVGFNNNSYFSKYFKQKIGKSPSDFISNGPE